MMTKRVVGAAFLACALGACADEDNIRDRIDVPDGMNDAGDTQSVDAAVDGVDGSDTSSPADSTTADTTPSDTQVVDTTVDTTDTTGPGDTADTVDTADVPLTDVVVPPWEVDVDAPWALGRPFAITSSDGPAEIGTPILAQGRYRALVPVRIAAGSLNVDGRAFPAPDSGAHAAIVALGGDLAAPTLGTAVYLDGALSAPELPRVAVCDGVVYASVTEANGQAARVIRLSGDLETIDVAVLTAMPGIGNYVRLGTPVCGGPGFVVTVDAVGGALFTAPDGNQAQFLPDQTANKTLILNGTRVFAENAAQVVSALAMRIIHITGGAGKLIFYVGEATTERMAGETLLQPGDQLVYAHDYAIGQGGSIASQGFFGREDIAAIATSADGRFAVVWVDVTAGATPADPELIEVVVSVYEADGARAWNKRSAAWTIDRIAFDDAGDLRVAGRFRSLEVLGVATVPVGPEDAFLAVLGGADGARKRHVVFGESGLAPRIASPIFAAVGDGECAAGVALDAVLVATGPTRVGIGVGADNRRCSTEALTAGDGQLLLAPVGVEGGGTDLWLSLVGYALDGGYGTPWPAGGALAGPIRARFPIAL